MRLFTAADVHSHKRYIFRSLNALAYRLGGTDWSLLTAESNDAAIIQVTEGKRPRTAVRELRVSARAIGVARAARPIK